LLADLYDLLTINQPIWIVVPNVSFAYAKVTRF
jgi:hypothetical protein